MYPRDRSQKIYNRQTKFYQCIDTLIRFIPHPVCVRNDSGTFEFYNSHFSIDIQEPFRSIELWFSELPFTLKEQIASTELTVLNCEKTICIIEYVVINKITYNIFIQLFDCENEKYILWQFIEPVKNVKKIETAGFIYKGKEKLINQFRRDENELHWRVLILHALGFSHRAISDVLGIKNGSSRNVITKIHSFFQVKNRDELVIIFIASGLFFSIAREVEYIISESIYRISRV